MVSGPLKVGESVTASAKKVLGDKDAKQKFPDTWQTAVLTGNVVLRPSNKGRSVQVQWDQVSTPQYVATRLLERPASNLPGTMCVPCVYHVCIMFVSCCMVQSMLYVCVVLYGAKYVICVWYR